MSLTGKVHEITCVRSDASLLFVGVNTYDFAHEAGFTTTTTVAKNDVYASTVDVYVVKIAYPSGSIPANTTTLNNLVSTATAAVTAKYGLTELV